VNAMALAPEAVFAFTGFYRRAFTR